jgi:hypothetical protein
MQEGVKEGSGGTFRGRGGGRDGFPLLIVTRGIETAPTFYEGTSLLRVHDSLLHSMADPHIKTFICTPRTRSLAFRSQPPTPDGAECNFMQSFIPVTFIFFDPVARENPEEPDHSNASS